MTAPSSLTRAALVLASIALLAGTVGCAPSVSVPTASPVSSSPASPAPTADPTAAPPAAVFGGACGSLLTDAVATSTVGGTLALVPTPVKYASDSAVPQLGGLDCYWNDPANKGGQFLEVIALPASAASDPTAKALDCGAEPGAAECYFNTVDSGYWFSAVLFGADGSTETGLKLAVAKLEAGFAAAASTAGAPSAPVQASGAWTKPSDCDALESAAGVTAASGNPKLVPDPADTESDQPDAYYSAQEASGYLGCVWSSESQAPKGALAGFLVGLAPGAAWAQHVVVTSKSVAVQIPGAKLAYTSSDAQGIEELDIFDGVNWLQIEPFSGPIPLPRITPVATALLKALDG